MLVYFPRPGGIIMADEPPDGTVAVMVGFLLLTPKSNGFCTKQIHMVNSMWKYLLEIKIQKIKIPKIKIPELLLMVLELSWLDSCRHY
jgi:hypothetical protein